MLARLESEIIRDLSVGGVIVDHTPLADGKRLASDMRLLEISLVHAGADPRAKVLTVGGRQLAARQALRKRALKHAKIAFLIA